MSGLLEIRKPLAMAVAIMLTAVVLLSPVGPVMAQESRDSLGRNGPTALSAQAGPTDRAELEAFLDDLLGKQMEERHIAGAAVSVVKDGKLFLAKGYGFADVEKGIPVDADKTLFRIGSVGKVFTWTAVMQLAEQGKLDLNADVNTYLDFRIPDTYPQPITLKHLLTHTSGLEDRLLEGIASDPSDLVSARDFLISHMSARVHPPGVYAGYSNYNAMLAGYIVARVSGQPYDQYIQEHILNPLGMVNSTAQPSVPPELRARRSVGYTYANGAHQAFPDYFGQPGALPSGFVQASVTDMARFMIAHLEGGLYSDATLAEARILKEATARQMQSTLYTPDPRLLGSAYGFSDVTDNGQRALGHQGYAPPMHSVLLLLPDQHLGVFVTYNTMSAGGLTLQHVGFQRAFFDHYYPAPALEPVQPPADFAKRAGRFVGSYRNSSAPATTLNKIAGFRGSYITEISDPGDGALLASIEGGAPLRLVEVEPLRFRQVDGPFSWIFREDAQGRIVSLVTDLMPQYAALRLDWYETASFNTVLLQGLSLIFLSVIPVAVVRLVRRRRVKGARAAHWLILGIGVLNLVFTAGTFLWVMQPSELHSPLLVYKVVLGLGVLSTVLTVGALAYTVLAWKNAYWGIASRVYYTLVTLAAAAFVWFLNYWNLLGWRF